jgi:hypothetical protein
MICEHCHTETDAPVVSTAHQRPLCADPVGCMERARGVSRGTKSVRNVRRDVANPYRVH